MSGLVAENHAKNSQPDDSRPRRRNLPARMLRRNSRPRWRRLARSASALMPLANRRDDSPRNRFEVTPGDVRLAEKTAREKNLELIGWYHSHPDAPARPSEYDREHAWPWYSYIIVSVQSGQPRDMNSWRLRDDRSAYDSEAIESSAHSASI